MDGGVGDGEAIKGWADLLIYYLQKFWIVGGNVL